MHDIFLHPLPFTLLVNTAKTLAFLASVNSLVILVQKKKQVEGLISDMAKSPKCHLIASTQDKIN
jgi:hypothetical protein